MLVTDIILIGTALLALIFASIVDIKIKEVPDWLSYGLISAGLGIRLLHTVIFNQPLFFVYGLIGLLIAFIVGSVLYYSKQWGGGDTKLLMGLGTIFATAPTYLEQSKVPFTAVLLMMILVSGAVYGVLWSLSLIFADLKSFKKEFKLLIKTEFSFIFQLCFLSLSLILIFLFFFIEIGVLKGATLALAFLLAVYPYLFIAIKSVENLHFYKYVRTERLVEGDWIAEDIKRKNKILFHKKSILEKKDIEKLKILNVKQVLIKDGIPFVPPFLIGTILALIFGNPLA